MRFASTGSRFLLTGLALTGVLGLASLGCRRQLRNNPADPLGSNFQPSLTLTRTPTPSPTPFPAPDGYENDGVYSSGALILPSTPQSRSLFPSGDQDWATFSLSQMGEVVIETYGSSGDTLLSLYDSTGALLLASDDNGGVGLFSSISVVLPVGTYYILVEENGNDAALPGYTLSLSLQDLTVTPTFTETPTATDSPTATASPTLTPECPEAITGELYGNINGAPVTGTTAGSGNQAGGSCVGMGGQERVYTLTLPTAMDITIAMCASGYDSLLYLRTSCSDLTTEIACNDDACGTGGTRSRLILPGLPAGRYYVFIDGFSGTGTYSVAVTSP